MNTPNTPNTPYPTRRQRRAAETTPTAVVPAPMTGRRALRTTVAPLTRRETLALERALHAELIAATERTETLSDALELKAPTALLHLADDPVHTQPAGADEPSSVPDLAPIPANVDSSPPPLPRTAALPSIRTRRAGWEAAASRPRPRPRSRSAEGKRHGARAATALAFAVALTAIPALSAAGLPTTHVETVAAPAATLTTPQDFAMGEASSAQVARDGYSVSAPKKPALAASLPTVARTADTFTNNPDSAVQWPFPVGVPISDGFGPRESPGGIGSTNHKGVDFTPGQGSPISAIADGVVRLVQRSDQGGLGVYVVIDHVIDGQPVSSWYGHMLTGSPLVEEGQAVKVGQQIGSVGNTGVSTGAHTHLEVHVNNTPVDPYAFISARN
ncbi:hypothetical protein GCM10010988_40810 [Cnuibacter physcomitrellae]|nr:hypothetical protein GCM10010988_40810 [Cnuibacter physcomitrellae]